MSPARIMMSRARMAVVLGGLLIAVFGGGYSILYLANWNRCVRTGEVMQRPVMFSGATDCMVRIDGSWVPLDSYVVVRKEIGG